MAEDDSTLFDSDSGATPPLSSLTEQSDNECSKHSPLARSLRREQVLPVTPKLSTPCSALPQSRAEKEATSKTKSTPESRTRGVEQTRAPWNHQSPIPGYPVPADASPYSRLGPPPLPPKSLESEPNALPLPPNTQYQTASVNLNDSDSLTTPFANMSIGANRTSQNTPLTPSEYYTPSAATPSGFSHTHGSSQHPSLGNAHESPISKYQDTLPDGPAPAPPLPPPPPPHTPIYLPQTCTPLTPHQEPPRAQNKKPAIDTSFYQRPSPHAPPVYPSSGENQSFPSSHDTQLQPSFLPSQRPMYGSQSGAPIYDANPSERPPDSTGKLSLPESSTFENSVYPLQNESSSNSSEDSSEYRSRVDPSKTSVKLPIYPPEPYTPTSSLSLGQGQYQTESNITHPTYSSSYIPPHRVKPITQSSDPALTQQAAEHQRPASLHAKPAFPGAGYSSQRPNANQSLEYSPKPEDSHGDGNSFSIPEPPVYSSEAYPSGNYGSTTQQPQGHQGSQPQPQQSSIPRPPPPEYVPEGYPGSGNNDEKHKPLECHGAQPFPQSSSLPPAYGYETRPFMPSGAIQPSETSALPGGVQGSTRPPIAPIAPPSFGAPADTKLTQSPPFAQHPSTYQPYSGSSSFQTPTQPPFQHVPTVPSGKLPPTISQNGSNGQLVNQRLQGTPKLAKPPGSSYCAPHVTQPQVPYYQPSTPQVYPPIATANSYPSPTVQTPIQQHNPLPSENAHTQSYVQQQSFGPHQNQRIPALYPTSNTMKMPFYKNPTGQQQVLPSYVQIGGNVSHFHGQGQPQYSQDVTAMGLGHIASQPQTAAAVPSHEMHGVPVMAPVNDPRPGFGKMNQPKVLMNTSGVPAPPAGPNMSQFVQPTPHPGGITGQPVYTVSNPYAAASSNLATVPPSRPPQNYNSRPPGQSAYPSFQAQGTRLYNQTNTFGYTAPSVQPGMLRPEGSVTALPSSGFPGNGLENIVPMPQQNMAPAGTQLSATIASQMPAGTPGYALPVPNRRWNSGAGNQNVPSQSGELYEHYQEVLYMHDQYKM